MSKSRSLLVVRVFFALCSVSLFALWLSYLYHLPTWVLSLNKVLALPLYPILAIKLGWGAFAMRPIHSKLGISNRRDTPQVVAIEPWAEDFTLMAGEELEVVAFGDAAIPGFQVVEWDGASQVYCNDTNDFEVLQGGVRLECGHNRQPEPAA